MIFVTVGTHEQQFDRLIKAADQVKGTGKIQEDLIIQTGYCRYEPKYADARQWLPYAEMAETVRKARIVITHGGPSSFMMPLQLGRIPVVVPRSKAFGEHVNDHQINFCRAVESRYHNILLVEDTEKLGDVLLQYEDLVRSLQSSPASNNARFNEKLETIVSELMAGR